jgi:hypothetical protein
MASADSIECPVLVHVGSYYSSTLLRNLIPCSTGKNMLVVVNDISGNRGHRCTEN